MNEKILEIAKYPDTNGPLVTMASGPVIFDGLGGILLSFDKNKEGAKWQIPGGTCRFDESFYEAAIREVKEESNLDIEIVNSSVKQPFIFSFIKEKDGVIEHVTLIHFLAAVIGKINIIPQDGLEVAFFPINNLPENRQPNVDAVVEYFS